MVDNCIAEIWREIPGWENTHLVSNMGAVKSLARKAPSSTSLLGLRSVNERLLKFGDCGRGYKTVGLYCYPKKERIKVHKLVMLVFVGTCPANQQINHINGIKSDNRLCNLEYCTPKQNYDHSRDVLKKWNKRMAPKFTSETVVEVRRLIASGLKIKAIANMYNVSAKRISYIKNGDTWKNIN